MIACPKCGGHMGKSSPEHTEIECLKCGWSPPMSVKEFERIRDHPTIFGDLRIGQLHITGANYNTVGDAPSVPTSIIIGYKGRRWELTISEAFETDKHGKRITPPAVLSEAEAGIRALFPPPSPPTSPPPPGGA